MLASRIALRAGYRSASPPVTINVRAINLSTRQQFSTRSSPLPSKLWPSRLSAGRPYLGAPLGSRRFNSTTAPTAATGTIPEFMPDDLANAVADTASKVSPDSMGYLSSLGMDFGFGPSSLLQTYLEAAHVFSGAPWWATIVVSVVAIRVAMFPFYCKMSSVTAQMKELNPLIVPIQQKMRECQLKGDQQGMLVARQEVMEVFKKTGVKRRWMVFPFTQIPIFYCFYRNLREMSELPIPEFRNQGVAWFSDLSVADPFLILPLASSCMIATQFGLGGEAGANSLATSMKTALMVGIPVLSFGVTYSWPAALTLYIATSSALGLAQTLVLRNPRFREWWGIYPLASGPTPNPIPLSNSINAMNVEKDALPKKEESRKQIGGQGSFLDRLTGGDDQNGSTGSLKKWRDNASEKYKVKQYEAYEKKRAKRLEEERKALELERERKRRILAAQKNDQTS